MAGATEGAGGEFGGLNARAVTARTLFVACCNIIIIAILFPNVLKFEPIQGTRVIKITNGK
jgi:hypothetical protein